MICGVILTLLSGRAAARAQAAKTLTVRSLADAPKFAKRALVIGVQDYQFARKLKVCDNDAAEFAALLKARFGFTDDAITLMTDAPDTALERWPSYTRLIHTLRTFLAGVDEKSEVVIYFSGHGTVVDNRDYLVPQDGDPQDVTHTCISYTDLKSEMETKRPARVLLIIDACRNLQDGKGDAPSGFGTGAAPVEPEFAELLSCRRTEISQEGRPEDFHESVFTHFLLKGLNGDPDAAGPEGAITFDSLKQYVRGNVSQYVQSRYNQPQNPDGRASLGAMLLARVAKNAGGTPIARNAPAPAPTHLSAPGRNTVGTHAPRRVNKKDGADLIYIPAGSFLMGDDDNSIIDYDSKVQNNPRHTVTLTGYYIYKNLVTVEEYKKYCRETGKQMPPAPPFDQGWSQDDHPIVDVSWQDAMDYATWAGGTLPSEAQWERAARGKNGRKYPWGDNFDPAKLWCSKSTPGDAGSTAAVGSYGVSIDSGCTDMAGNALEWCRDWYDENFWRGRAADRPDPENQNVGTQQHRVRRGGCWYNAGPLFFRSAFRSWGIPIPTGGINYYGYGGFRCVVAAP
jgi:formylglycine-generating enzyme required for sulfatase activity